MSQDSLLLGFPKTAKQFAPMLTVLTLTDYSFKANRANKARNGAAATETMKV
jgi:hypothetical protein